MRAAHFSHTTYFYPGAAKPHERPQASTLSIRRLLIKVPISGKDHALQSVAVCSLYYIMNGAIFWRRETYPSIVDWSADRVLS
jgi:hypothetical protein